MKLIAFWQYDLFPYVLHGTVERIDEKGRCYIKEYSGMFTPLTVLPEEAGRPIATKLEELRRQQRDAKREVDRDFQKRVSDLAPFLACHLKGKQ